MLAAQPVLLFRSGLGAAMKFGLWNSNRRRQTRNVPPRRWRDVSRHRRRLIRALAIQVDALADNAVTSQDVSALENGVDTLVGAISSSRAAGEVLPRGLEKLLSRLVRKLKRAWAARAARRAAQAAAWEQQAQQGTLKTFEFVQPTSNVVVMVGLAFSLFVSLHIFDRAAQFDEIVSFLAEQARSLPSSWSFGEPARAAALVNQRSLEMPRLPMANTAVGVAVGALPSWAVPEITGALPPAGSAQNGPPRAGRSVAIAEDKLPATIGNPALRAAATAGDPAAAYEVASRFAEGRGVPQSHEEEARWLERAANQGFAPAQFRLGGLYERGIGVKKDLDRARDLYLAAALKGNAKAMHNLAVLYAAGVNGAPDYETAAAWFRKAADHGIKDSQYNLAILYGRGIGVQQNHGESYKWFVLAANQGDGDAALKRDEVAAYLDPQTREAARLATQSWSPQPQPDDAINVKTQAAWATPAEIPQPTKPKPRPGGGNTRTAEGKPN
jgi:TPR repeat protein